MLQALVAVGVLVTCNAANAQLVINEVLINSPGSADASDGTWEYIELYGRPGMDLTGYMVALINDEQAQCSHVEIDEAFSLDRCRVGPDGVFVLYNANTFGFSNVQQYLTPNPSWLPFLPVSPTNRQFLNGESFGRLHIALGDVQGNLNNDGSATVMLLRRRPFFHNDSQGFGVYEPGYLWDKDSSPDDNYDSEIDFGTELPCGESIQTSVFEPYQAVDSVEWSNLGGKEYGRDEEYSELSDTPGFNPDAVSRLHYYISNPGLGHRTRDITDGNGQRIGFDIVATRAADESWIYGEMYPQDGEQQPGQPYFPDSLGYNPGVDVEGFKQVKGPTDPNAMPYDGACDPEWDEQLTPAGCTPNPSGQYHFTDLDVAGFEITPGHMNDHPTSSNPLLKQYRFASFVGVPQGFQGQVIPRGDFTCDGQVNQQDLALIVSRAGASLDDVEITLYNNATPNDPSDDYTYPRWKWQMQEFQQMLMMLDMAMNDGPGGTNSTFVTQADIDAVSALVPPPSCAGDANGDNRTNGADLSVLLATFGQNVQAFSGADYNGDGQINGADLSVLLSSFGCGG